jgi:protein-L-isoaspartate(D-aspartate) O-methyltransferase
MVFPEAETLLDDLRARGVSPRVLAAIAAVPRDRFVPPGLRARAWEDGPLPIGGGQTISQPRVVALMCDALALTGDERVLDVGTGSG